MKGVILGIAPDAHLIDLTHEIPPQDVAEGTFALETAVAYFPRGTVHLAVVDPGVGSARRALLVTTARAAFVGPDNGLFTPFLDEEGARAWVLDRPEYWLPEPSRTFHGRDIFAPVAGALAAGVGPEELGTPIEDAVRAALPAAGRAPEPGGNGEISGCVMHVDRFGNLITNVPGEWLGGGKWSCEIMPAPGGPARGDVTVTGPHAIYAAVEPGELVLLVSSGGKAEIAVRDGSAAERLAARSGAAVRFRKLED